MVWSGPGQNLINFQLKSNLGQAKPDSLSIDDFLRSRCQLIGQICEKVLHTFWKVYGKGLLALPRTPSVASAASRARHMQSYLTPNGELLHQTDSHCPLRRFPFFICAGECTPLDQRGEDFGSSLGFVFV